MINIEFDDKKVSGIEITELSNAIQKIVSGTTKIKDVFVYANTSKIKTAPIEIWIRMSAHKIKDEDKLIAELKDKLSAWKKEGKFKHPINLTLIPMHWKIEMGI